MERPSSSSSRAVFVSCEECLKLKLPWKRKGAICDVTTTTFCPPMKKHHHQRTRVSGFKYDPLSYAQNFDDSAVDIDDEFYSHGFMSRFVAPPSASKSSSSSRGAH